MGAVGVQRSENTTVVYAALFAIFCIPTLLVGAIIAKIHGWTDTLAAFGILAGIFGILALGIWMRSMK